MKKIIIYILIISLFTAIPKFTFAQMTVTDPGLTAVASTIATAVGVSAEGTQSLNIKEYALDQIAYMLGKMVLRQLTSSVVNWINTGFEGNPAFVSNPGEFFKNVGDEMLGELIQNDKYLGFLCSPFSIDLKLQLAFKYRPFQKRISCTLTDVIANSTGALQNASINGFTAGDFSQGGWPAFVSMTTEPQNNLYGAYIQADLELSARIANMQQLKRDELNQGRGFLSWQKCSDVAAPGDVDFVGPTQPGEGQNNVSSDFVGPTEAGSYQREKHCEVQTPGSVIAGVLDANTAGPLQELHLADELNEIVNALFAQMVKQVLTTGLRGLSGSGPSDPDAYIRQLQDQQASTNEQLTSIKNKILQSIDGYINRETEYKTYKDQSLNKFLNIKTKLDAAKACFISKFGSTPDSLTKIGQIESIIQTKISPKSTTLLSELSSQDALINSLKKIKADAIAAKTVNEILAPSQEFGNYTGSSDIMHNQKDVDDALAERDKNILDLTPTDEQASRFLQECTLYNP